MRILVIVGLMLAAAQSFAAPCSVNVNCATGSISATGCSAGKIAEAIASCGNTSTVVLPADLCTPCPDVCPAPCAASPTVFRQCKLKGGSEKCGQTYFKAVN